MSSHETAPGVPPPTPQEIQEDNERRKRYEDATEKLISQRDTLLADANDKPVTPEWDRYRQHLKDLPAMVVNIPMPIDLDEDGNLVGVEWPEVPAPAPSNEEKEK
jgi:hypothetical protein